VFALDDLRTSFVEQRLSPKGKAQPMKLAEQLSKRSSALKVAEVAAMFGVTPQHIYKMAASGKLPSFRVAGAVRFDPQDLANWLMKKSPTSVAFQNFGNTENAALRIER
jgi:excisionase family DNA binding protein